MPKAKKSYPVFSFETTLTEEARRVTSPEDKLEKHVKTESIDVKSMPVSSVSFSRKKTSEFEQAIRTPKASVYYEATMPKADVQHRRMLAVKYKSNMKKRNEK